MKVENNNLQETYITVDELFYELEDLYYELVEDKKPTYKTFKLIGSRESGKTYRIVDFLVKAFFQPNKENIIYVFRKEDRGRGDTFTNFCNQIQNLGIQYNIKKNFHKGEYTLYNGRSRIIFRTINDEKIDIKKGGGAGLPTWLTADNIFAFYEECSHMNGELITVFNSSLRGNINTNIFKFYASNPWDEFNWYVKEMNVMLPENETLLIEQGYQKAIYYDEFSKENVFVLRNSIWINPYVSEDKLNNLFALKRDFPHQYRIQYLGLSGNEEDNIYVANMKDMKEVNWDIVDSEGGYFQGGLDWGNGTSKGGSPTTLHFGKISTLLGVDILDEMTIWNNVGAPLSDNEIMDKSCKFYRNLYNAIQKPFKVYVDNGFGSNNADNSLHRQFQARLRVLGMSEIQIEFVPAIKPLIDERVQVVNYMLASGLLRIDTNKCNELYKALKSSFWIKKTSPREGTKRERDHTTSHWINSGVEYILGTDFYSFQTNLSAIYTEKRY